jgi:hypothetical protein
LEQDWHEIEQEDWIKSGYERGEEDELVIDREKRRVVEELLSFRKS